MATKEFCDMCGKDITNKQEWHMECDIKPMHFSFKGEPVGFSGDYCDVCIKKVIAQLERM